MNPSSLKVNYRFILVVLCLVLTSFLANLHVRPSNGSMLVARASGSDRSQAGVNNAFLVQSQRQEGDSPSWARALRTPVAPQGLRPSAFRPFNLPTPTPIPDDQLSADRVPGEIVIVYSANAKAADRAAMFQQEDLELTREIPQLRIAVVSAQETALAAKLRALRLSPFVLSAEPNYLAISQETIPNDPGFAQQWGLRAIDAPAGWDVETGASDVVIAVVDTGVDLQHPDLADKIVPGWDFVNDDDTPQDDNGHGTHVAGIAAASTNNGIGVAGVAWGARIMPVKVLDASGSGGYSAVAEGIVYAVDHGAQVINLSLGGAAPSAALEEAVNYAYERGAVVVAAAGNRGSAGVIYPARYPNAIAVAAVDPGLNVASFSSYGPEVDMAAPGVGIYSTFVAREYREMSGSSMAAPYVSGAAALLAGTGRYHTPNHLRSALEGTATDLGMPGPDPGYGWGMLRISSALAYDEKPAETTTPAITASPQATLTATRSGPTSTATPATPLPTPFLTPDSSQQRTELARAGNVLLSYIWDETGIFLYASDRDGSHSRLIVREHAAMVPLDLVTLAPDGSRVAYVRASDQRSFTDAGIRVTDTFTGKELLSFEAQDGYFNVSPLWAPDSKNLAFVRGYLGRTSQVKAELWLARLSTQKASALVTDESFGPAFFYGRSFAVAWTARGDAIQYYDEIGSHEVYQINIDRGSYPKAAATSVVPSIAAYVARIQTAHTSTTSAMTKPISGLPDYYGRNSSYYNVLHLQRYYDTGDFEGSGTHPGVDIKNLSCSSTIIRSVAAGTVWSEVHNWGPSGSNPCGDNTGFGASAGNHVIVRHEIAGGDSGYQGTVYAIYEHLYNVSGGACSTCSLLLGSQIGTAGSTGNSSGTHLHFQMDREGAQFHPYWPANCCSDTTQIPTVIANTVNPMMFVQAHESSAGVTVYDNAGLCPPYTSCLNETFHVSDPYLRENPIGESTISSARIPSGWVLVVYPERYYQGTPQEFYSDVTNFAAYGLDNSIRSLKVAYMACPAGTLAQNEVPRAGTESCLPGGNQPTPTPTPYVPPGVIDGFRLISVSSPTVLKGQTFNVNVTYEIVSGSLLQSRGDHLHATPEDNSNAFGAWPVQGVSGSHYAGETYTFSFSLTAPQTTGVYESHWRLRVGGNHIGPEAVIRFTVQDQPPSPPGGVYVCTSTGYGGDCYGPLTVDYSSVDPINDQIESVWINGCYSAVLYWDSNFSGEHMHTGGTTDLGDHWRNQTSSIRVRSCDNAAFTIYGLGDYNGEAWASDRTIYDLGHWDKNDWAQSMRVASGKGIVACEHADFHGRCGRATGPAQFSDINALAQGLRNGLSSVRVCDGACPQPPGSPAIIYPTTGGHAPSNKDVILQWTGDGWQYYAELWGGGISGTRQFGWSATNQWNVGLLPVSSSPYYWHVRGWNGYGEGGWADGTFYVQPPTVEVMGVYTTDENGPSSQVAGEPRMQSDEVDLSAFKTAFNAGDPIQLYIDTNNDFTVNTEAAFEWRVTDPAGRLDSSLSWSGTLSTYPGQVGWYMPATIPSDALTGEYTFTGLITYGGQTTSKSTSFYVTGLPIVQAVAVFTTDELGPAAADRRPARLDQAPVQGAGYKNSFTAGDGIGLCIDVYSNLALDALAGFQWNVTDPLGRAVQALSWNGDLTTPAGRVWWCLSSTIPIDAMSGDYLFQGSVTHAGLTTGYETIFHVTGPLTLEVVEVFTTDESGPGAAGSALPRESGGVRSSAYKTSFNAGDQIQLYLGTYSDYPDPQEAEYQWLVINPLGEEVPVLEWSGTLTAAVGRDWWYLPSAIPADAYTGEYVFIGIVTHNGRTTYAITAFQVTGPARVDVLDVFATDENGVYGSSTGSPRSTQSGARTKTIKNAFNAGDPIRLYIDTYNNAAAEVSAHFTWSVVDPFGQPVPELSWTGTLTTPVQSIWWFLSSTVPQAAISGEYSYEGRIIYDGRTSSRSTSLCVSGSIPAPYTAASEVPSGDPPYFAVPYARTAFDFAQSPGGTVTVTLHSDVVPEPPNGVDFLPGYWDITADFSGFTTDVILSYSACDLQGIDEDAITGAACWNPNRAGWTYIAGVVDMEANNVTLTGIQSFSRCFLIASSPPKAPEGLTIAKEGDAARLSWQPVTEDIRGIGILAPDYHVYRGTASPYFTPTESNRIAIVSDTTYLDLNALLDTEHNYYYLVKAVDAQGQTSAMSGRVGKVTTIILPGQGR